MKRIKLIKVGLKVQSGMLTFYNLMIMKLSEGNISIKIEFDLVLLLSHLLTIARGRLRENEAKLEIMMKETSRSSIINISCRCLLGAENEPRRFPKISISLAL